MGEQSTDLQNEFYCFISYKHKKDGRFAEDQSWAEKLEGSFHRTKISVPPVAERAIIHGTSDDSNEYIGRVYRDFTNLSGGYYTEEIQSGLRCSRKLVSLVSDEMLADQNKAVKEAKGAKKKDIYNDAWCYREIRDFLSYSNHTLDDVILVYIGKQTDFTLDIVPYPLLDINLLSGIEQVFPDPNQNKAFSKKSRTDKLKYLQDHWRGRNAIMALKEGEKTGLADLVAAKVACSIFGLKGEGAQAFISFREQELPREEAEKKKHRSQKTLLFVIIGVVFAIALFIGCLFLSSHARSLVEKARTTLDQGNRLKAQRLAHKAHKTWPFTQGTAEIMWMAGDSVNAVFSARSPIYFDRKDSLFSYVESNRYVVVADARTYEEVERFDARKALRARLSPDAYRVFVDQDDDKFHTSFRIYDRRTHEWSSSGLSYRDKDKVLDFSENGLRYCQGNELIDYDGNWYFLRDEQGELLSPFTASFIGTDSIYLALTSRPQPDKGTRFSVLLYNFADKDSRIKHSNVFGPSAVFSFPAGTAGCSISTDSNTIISFTENSIDSWSIDHQDREYALRPLGSTRTRISIADIRFCGSQEWVLVRDKEGKGYCYPYGNNHYSFLDSDGAFGREAKNAIPIGIGSQGYQPILYYIKGKKDKNIVLFPSDASFTLPHSVDNATVSSTIHGETLCVSVRDETSGAMVSYLYSGGDGRIITPHSVSSVLSSKYYVEFRLDYLTKATSQYSTSTHSGPCLIDAQTGEHIMHLSLLEEDINDWKSWGENGFFLYKDKLLSICRNDSKSFLRFYDIGTRSFIKEVIVEGFYSQGWMSDGAFFYDSKDTLYRVSADADTDPEIICDSYYYRTGDVNELFFPFQTKEGERLWYSPADRAVYPMPSNDNGLFTPDGAYYVDLDWHQDLLSIIDSRSLDTLFSRPYHSWAGSETFSRDARKFIYCEDRTHVSCMDIPSGTERWNLDIWAPVSLVAGNKYLVLQSTSLFVVNIANGRIVCEFETDPSRELKLMLSPDEKWLLAGDQLYSLKSKERIATGLDTDYFALENDYILYPKKIMRLPTTNSILNRK